MSKLKIYGMARTRAFRALWVAMELGIDYEHIPVEIGDAGAREGLHHATTSGIDVGQSRRSTSAARGSSSAGIPRIPCLRASKCT